MNSKMARNLRIAAAITLLFAPGFSIGAADAFEIQVYEGDINDPGQLGLELHLNTVPAGRKTQTYAAEIPMHGLTHLTLEPSFGITRWWEMGGYLQSVVTSGGQAYYGGAKLRSKFMIPKEKTGIFKLGLNVEVGKVPVQFEEGGMYSELRPILSIESGRWMFAMNPNIEFSLESASIRPELGPAAKIKYDTGMGFGIGAEYYAEYGPIAEIKKIQGESGILYMAFDLASKDYEINFGIGHGVLPGTDDLVIKAIFGHGF